MILKIHLVSLQAFFTAGRDIRFCCRQLACLDKLQKFNFTMSSPRNRLGITKTIGLWSAPIQHAKNCYTLH